MIWSVLLLLLRAWSLLCTRVTIVSPDDMKNTYLIRWHVWHGLYLHKFVTSDPDRGWHCHPWIWAMSRILDGAYMQSFPPGAALQQYLHRGDLNVLREGDYHRVILMTRVVWTLFRHGPKHGRSWHFLSYDMKTISQPQNRDAPIIRRGLIHFD